MTKPPAFGAALLAIAMMLLPGAGTAFGQSVMGPSTPRLAPRGAGEPPRVKDEPPSTIAFRAAREQLNDGLEEPTYSGNPDRDFIAAVNPLRQGLIDNARVELRYGADPETRQLAQRLLDAQESQPAPRNAK